MIKKMGYRWRLRQVMASREMYATTAPLVRRVGLAGVLTVRHPLLCGEWWSAQITQLGAPVTAPSPGIFAGGCYGNLRRKCRGHLRRGLTSPLKVRRAGR